MAARVCDLVLTLALCHNVTPVFDDDVEDATFGEITYQAASPDEIAIVEFCELVGLKLFKRDRHRITLMHVHTSQLLEFDVLHNFPFSSETKRMGILVKSKFKDEVWFLQKVQTL